MVDGMKINDIIPIKLIKEATKVFADVSDVGDNVNLKTFLAKAEDGDRVGVGAATIAIGVGIVSTAHTVIEKTLQGGWAKMGGLINFL